MGNADSYIKIKTNDLLCSICYKHNDKFKRIIISVHPDNKFKKTKFVNYNSFYNFGDWYEYDNDVTTFDRVLMDFDPTCQNVVYLLGRLEVECDLKRYKSSWQKLSDWVSFVGETINNVKDSFLSIGFGVITTKLLGW